MGKALPGAKYDKQILGHVGHFGSKSRKGSREKYDKNKQRSMDLDNKAPWVTLP